MRCTGCGLAPCGQRELISVRPSTRPAKLSVPNNTPKDERSSFSPMAKTTPIPGARDWTGCARKILSCTPSPSATSTKVIPYPTARLGSQFNIRANRSSQPNRSAARDCDAAYGRIDRKAGIGVRRSRYALPDQDRACRSPPPRVDTAGRPGGTISAALDRSFDVAIGWLLAGATRMGLAVELVLELELAAFDCQDGAAALLVITVGLATGAGDSPAQVEASSAAEAVARGKSAYDLGRWDEALAQFQIAITRAPASAVPRYDAAATLYQLKALWRGPRTLSRSTRAGRRILVYQD